MQQLYTLEGERENRNTCKTNKWGDRKKLEEKNVEKSVACIGKNKTSSIDPVAFLRNQCRTNSCIPSTRTKSSVHLLIPPTPKMTARR